MKHSSSRCIRNSDLIRRTGYAGLAALRLLPIAVLVSACGGGGGGGDQNNGGSNPQVNAILQVGMQRQYTGMTTRQVVYVAPTAAAPDNTLTYTFTQIQSVTQAPAGVPASFDLHNVYSYVITQDPGVGTVPLSQTVDNYENLSISESTQTASIIGQTITTTTSDETANALGTGTYIQTTVTTASYPTPRDSLPYPLQTGATQTVPQSLNQTTTFSDLNGNGAAPSNGSSVGYTLTRTANDDGSYAYQTDYVNGNSFTRTQNSDGSGSQLFTGPTSSTATMLGLPAQVNGATTLPVSVTVTGSTTATTNYAAADWYPNGGVPSTPLVSTRRIVVGPVASLPAGCTGALLRPDIVEVDTTTTDLNPLGPTYAVTNTRSFNSGDAVGVCQLSSEIQTDYDLKTGALVSTTTTTTTTLLNAINY